MVQYNTIANTVCLRSHINNDGQMFCELAPACHEYHPSTISIEDMHSFKDIVMY